MTLAQFNERYRIPSTYLKAINSTSAFLTEDEAQTTRFLPLCLRFSLRSLSAWSKTFCSWYHSCMKSMYQATGAARDAARFFHVQVPQPIHANNYPMQRVRS